MIHLDCSVGYLRQGARQLLAAASSRPSGGFSKLEAHVGGLAAGWRRERVKMVPTVVCAQSIPAGSLTC